MGNQQVMGEFPDILCSPAPDLVEKTDAAFTKKEQPLEIGQDKTLQIGQYIYGSQMAMKRRLRKFSPPAASSRSPTARCPFTGSFWVGRVSLTK